MKRFVVCVAVLLVFTGTNSAYALKVGLVGADVGVSGFVKSYLDNTGLFETITQIDASISTPALATLSEFDAVLVWSTNTFADRTLLGNNLADYVDNGGGVVLAAYTTYGSLPLVVGGRFESEAYNPFTYVSGSVGAVTIGSFDAGSPIMSGVTNINGYFHVQAQVRAGATLVASWSDGSPLAAFDDENMVVGVNLYPGEGQDANLSGDYPQLFANALIFSVDRPTQDPPTPAIDPGPTSVPIMNGWWLLPALAGGAALMRRRRK